jgi:hypothetical protein
MFIQNQGQLINQYLESLILLREGFIFKLGMINKNCLDYSTLVIRGIDLEIDANFKIREMKQQISEKEAQF